MRRRSPSGSSTSVTATGWSRSSAAFADNARCFVVVGAAHLVGPGSLVELLRERKHLVVQQ